MNKKEKIHQQNIADKAKKKYIKPKIESLGKLKNITLGASLVGNDTKGAMQA